MFITSMALVVAIIFIFITIFSISTGYKIFKENYKRSGQLNSRTYLILITSGISQAFFVLLTFIFWLISNFDIALVTLDVFAIIFIVIFILLGYKSFGRRVSKDRLTPTISSSIEKKYFSPSSQKIIIIFGITVSIPVIIIYLMYFDYITELAIVTGSETMIEVNPYLEGYYKDKAYLDMAKRHDDASFCDNISDGKLVEICKKRSVETQ